MREGSTVVYNPKVGLIIEGNERETASRLEELSDFELIKITKGKNG